MSAPDYKDDLVFPPQPKDNDDKTLCWLFSGMMVLSIFSNVLTLFSNAEVLTTINEPNVIVSKCDMITVSESTTDLSEWYGDE